MGRGGGVQDLVLTRREREVLVELCRPRGRGAAFTEPAATREIAAALFVTEAAVKQHLLRLYDKFGIHEGGENRRVALANAAVGRGLVPADGAPPAEAGSVAAPAPPPTELVSSAVRAGHLALARREWGEAFDVLAEAEQRGELTTAEDLAALGEAALWAGKPEASQDARQRAYQAYAAAKNERRAAVMALGLVTNFAVRLKGAVAAGWLGKARRHLEPLAVGREHALLAATEGLALVLAGQLEGGLERCRAAMELGHAHGDRDALALGQVFAATALARSGQREDATRLIDEAMATATAGELGPHATGLVYCRTICTCLDVFDFKRALEWTEVIEEARRAIGEGGFPGDCRVHRATLLAVRGDSDQAEVEARVASAETVSFDLTHVGLAACEIGELRLRAGDLPGAEAAFAEAADLGASPEPGRTRLLLARGDTEAAGRSIAAAVRGVDNDPLRRARLLPVAVEVALALARMDDAERAAGDLDAIARSFECAALLAAGASARGQIALGRGEAGLAADIFRRAARLWLEASAPYEAARARLELARALLLAGDRDDAAAELAAVERTFRRLGGTWDADRAAQLAGARH